MGGVKAYLEEAFKNSPEIDWEASYVIGDRDVDLGLAQELNCQSILVLTGYGPSTQKEFEHLSHTFQVFPNVLEFARRMKKYESISKCV
mgnify:CR=1 FL=1